MRNYQKYSKLINKWKKLVFPARPSPEELVIFDRLMKNKKGKLLILGSTPEFRDLGFKNKLKVTCADINQDMLEGMKQVMQYPNDKENLVKCNWLNMPFKDNYFDLVFSEQSINIIKAKYFNDFFKEVKRVMKNKGIFVSKSIVLNDLKEDEIIKQYRKEKRDIHYLYNHLFHMKKRYKNHQTGHKEFGLYVNKLLKQGKITKKEHDDFFKFWGEICKTDVKLNVLEKHDFEVLLKKYFKIKDILFGDDFEKHRLHPIYVLEK